ncbi:hemerythrin domain-containing protein [Streptomyces scopuliridis]|uniref:Hemerythrin domain-containing protein n=1 Tax=Streptomyces scopuliridis TaxID=452529 RepID=A0ACD4ZQD3_9ACTN|nr:hemerythrin domain-containing protein [Streptomyces scopuliridis]WSC00381.1 hemerythrin domain-containing protein [Streptomyces scopuliridis]
MNAARTVRGRRGPGRLTSRTAEPRCPRDTRGTRQLRAHCLAFCSALSRHHTDEDDGTFPALAARRPELRPVLELLRQDHEVVSGILRSVEDLLANADAAGLPGVLRELDGLSALLESHFTYEEKRIVTALNAPAAPDRDDGRLTWSRSRAAATAASGRPPRAVPRSPS